MFTNIQAVLFDIDGTLLDTSEYIIRAFEHTLAQAGFDDVAQDREKIKSVIGLPLTECYTILTNCSTEVAERMIQERFAFQKQKLDLVTAFAQVPNVLHAIKQKGLRIGACTNRSNTTVQSTLQHTNIAQYIDVVICPEDTVHHKPHPEPILTALARTDTKAEHAVMVGDSAVDIESGKQAGTKTVRATYGIHTNDLYNPNPDAFIDSIEQLLPLLFTTP